MTQPRQWLTPWELAIVRGRNPYGWQVEALEAFGRGYPVALVACNGSGKSTEVSGGAVDWFFYRYPQGQLVATSSSWNQLANQTWAALESRLPDDFVLIRGSAPARIKTPKGGTGIGFSTNKATRAEGWHPKISPETDPVMILIDEGKSVPDSIWYAFDRCTVAYFLAISSPGLPYGRFYDCFHRLKKFYWTRRVPSTECPHIPKWKIERDRVQMDPETFKSAHEAEFMDGGQFLCITPRDLNAALQFRPARDSNGPKYAFFDFARGGDENVFAYREGNQIRIVDAWKQRDTTQAVRRFIAKAKELKLLPNQCWGDADGLGGPMVDTFKDEGFPINEFHGGQAATDSDNYENLISEVWIQGLRRIQRGDFWFEEPEPILYAQLTTRLFEWGKRGKKRVQSKDDMRKAGIGSPDRADAFLGAAMVGPHLLTDSKPMTRETIETAGRGVSPFQVPIITNF